MPPKPRQAKATAAEARPTRAAATKATAETTTKTATKATTKTAAKPAAKPATKAAAKPATKAAAKPTKAAPAAKQTKATKAASAKPAPKAKATAASKKRKLESEDEASPEPEKAPPAKRTKAAAAAPSKRQRVAKSPTPKPEKPVPVINTAPERVLEVFAFGNGENGELGLGPSKTETTVPRRNPFLDPRDPAKFHVVQLDCGGMHTIALTKDNKIVTWGVNDKGALGRDTAWEGGLRDADASDSESEDGDLNPKESTPADIPASAFPEGTKFVQVAAGDSCSFALTDTGLIYGWGTFLNSEGKECFGYDTDGEKILMRTRPMLIPGLSNISQLSCGANHIVALAKDGKVFAWGVGEQNQLGRRILGRRRDESFKPTRVEVARSKASYIASGPFHSFAIDGNGDAWAWGLNSFGQAGYTRTAGSDDPLVPYPMRIEGLRGKEVQALEGGHHHSAAVTKDGRHFTWGRLDGGQLGIKFTDEQLQDEDLIRRDENDRPRICLVPTEVTATGKATAVGCGTDHTLFVNDQGLVYTTGFGTMGQLGLGDYDDADVATELPKKPCGGRHFVWAGAGGQFSVVAAPADMAPPPKSAAASETPAEAPVVNGEE